MKINYAFRLQPEGGTVELESPMHLGPIARDVPLHVLFEFVIEPVALEQPDVMILDAALKISVTAMSAPSAPIRLRVVKEVHEKPSAEPPPTRILSALSKLTLYRMQERARNAAEGGEYSSAARHLQNLATHLLSQGQNSLAKTALMEAENLERMHAFSASGNKDIKYNTRALLLNAPKEKVR